MNSKVSLVIPCYNKEHYIEDMFKSIYKQTWNNIEVIMIDDCSTDNTKNLIKKWISKFQDRDFEVKFFQNEVNKGVAFTVKKGLENVTGNYVSIIDSDDEIDIEYTSKMAHVLDNDTTIDFVICDIAVRKEYGGKVQTLIEEDDVFEKGKLLEKYLLQRLKLSACRYMFRLSFLHFLNLPEKFITCPSITQEPQIMLPVFNSEAKYIKISKSLYIYNMYARGIVKEIWENPIEEMMGRYLEVVLKTIALLPITEERKIELSSIASIGTTYKCGKNTKKRGIDEVFFRAISNKILNEKIVLKKFKRVIVYVTSDFNIDTGLLLMADTLILPDLILRDEDDINVLESLQQKYDLIVCLSKIKEINDKLKLFCTKNEMSFMTYSKFLDYLAQYNYPN